MAELNNTSTIGLSWLGRLFCHAYDTIEIANDGLNFIKNGNLVNHAPFNDAISFAIEKRGLFSSGILIPLEAGIQKIGWLHKGQSKVFTDQINERLKSLVNGKIAAGINKFDELTLKKYPRDSWLERIGEAGNALLKYKTYANETLLSDDNREGLGRIFDLLPPDPERLCQVHEEFQLKDRHDFFEEIEKYPLTLEQRLGVLRSNDLNMVLAAAGTGKTSVIVSKIFDLIERGLCEPKDILVMAFNRAAAIEIRERFDNGVAKRGLTLKSDPEISTFHALGRKILKESGERVAISVFTEDNVKLNQWITEWIYRIIEEGIDNLHKLLRFIPEPFDPFDCPDELSYERSVRDNEYRTLLGERVRGHQEMLIANYLFLHGVPYKYEAPYVSKRRIKENIDYRPDFHLTGTDIYIEHFGIDRDGNTRPDIDKESYNREMKDKRALHARMGTRLIETYHYEFKEGRLESGLAEKLNVFGVKTKKPGKDEIQKIIKDNRKKISLWGEILMKALAAARIESLDEEGITDRFKKAKLDEYMLKGQLVGRLLNDYKNELAASQTIDFDDMILRATDMVKKGRFKPRWKYILVDEFQDISTSRMNLVMELVKNGPSPSLTVVGDDWQAIYRFAGGKLEFTTKFADLVGPCTSTFLRKTFRYHDNIASVSEKFVTENPNQIKKNVETHTHVDGSKIFLHDHYSEEIEEKKDYPGKVAYILDSLRKSDPDGSVAVIARYNFLLNEIRKELKDRYSNVHYWTFHKSKGLEADHVILVGLESGSMGFPSENRDEAMVAALLPLADDYEYSEERRLMYVGMTRPKHQLHIIADPQAPSAFVRELLSAWYNINIISPYFKKSYADLHKCPYCVEGYLKKISGQYGDFYVCSTDRGCPVGKARVCEKCGFPSIDAVTMSKCVNPECGHSFPICEVCGRPMRVREGKYGKFLGCSGYGIKDDQCTNTRSLR